MNVSRKGVAPYLMAIGAISLIMGAFLFFVLTLIYGDDPQRCESVQYSLEPICRYDGGARVRVLNDGESQISMIAGSREENAMSSFSIPTGNQQVVEIPSTENIVFTPQVQEGVEEVACEGKVETIQREELGPC